MSLTDKEEKLLEDIITSIEDENDIELLNVHKLMIRSIFVTLDQECIDYNEIKKSIEFCIAIGMFIQKNSE